MAILISVILLFGMIKLTGLFLKICGKIVGAILSLIGYAIVGAILYFVLKISAMVLPILLIIAITSITEWKGDMKK